MRRNAVRRAARLPLLLLLLVVPWSRPATAQAPGPESIAEDYFATLREEGVVSIAGFLHPDALATFKEMLVPVFEAEAAAGEADLRGATFGADATIEQIRASDDTAFMQAFLRVVAAQMESIRFDEIEIVGTVAEGEDRHVLARLTVSVGELSMTEFEVLSFSPHQDGWRLQLDGQMRGLAATLRAGIGIP